MNGSSIPIFLAKLNIAKRGHFATLKINNTKTNLKLIEMFEEIGIIRGYHILDDDRIKVFFRYIEGSFGIFAKIIQISKSGRRVYADVLDLYRLKKKMRK